MFTMLFLDAGERAVLEPPSDKLLKDNPLWNHDILDKVTNNKYLTNDVSALQSKQLIPGTIAEIDLDHRCYLPIMIIHNNKYNTTETSGRTKGVDKLSIDYFI